MKADKRRCIDPICTMTLLRKHRSKPQISEVAFFWPMKNDSKWRGCHRAVRKLQSNERVGCLRAQNGSKGRFSGSIPNGSAYFSSIFLCWRTKKKEALFSRRLYSCLLVRTMRPKPFGTTQVFDELESLQDRSQQGPL